MKKKGAKKSLLLPNTYVVVRNEGTGFYNMYKPGPYRILRISINRKSASAIVSARYFRTEKQAYKHITKLKTWDKGNKSASGIARTKAWNQKLLKLYYSGKLR